VVFFIPGLQETEIKRTREEMNDHLETDPEELDEITSLGHKVRNTPQQRKGKRIEKLSGIKQVESTALMPDEVLFPFSYHASRYEKQWLMDSVMALYQQDWIEDILKMVRGGKEASVYLCSAPKTVAHPLLAAKVYRPRRFRNLKNDHLYREGRDQLDATGRIILDDRSLHAMQKRTDYGLKLLHSSWVGHEFHTMQLLFDAGVDLPKPYASSDNLILMEYVGDAANAAPTLNTVTLTSTEARFLFQQVMFDVELMLRVNRVHADLSAYNILYWQGQIKLIDFPQAINPDENRNAYRIFNRDIARICSYFASRGVETDPLTLTKRLWKEKGRSIDPMVDPLYLDPEDEGALRLWRSARE